MRWTRVSWLFALHSRWILAGAAISVVYIVVLLLYLFQSQRQLSQDAEAKVIADSLQTSAVLSDVMTERDLFALSVADGAAIQTFLTNRALGMSMRYGLGSNLFAIEEDFKNKIERTKSLGKPVYERILFFDLDGTLLSDTQAGVYPKPFGRLSQRPGASTVDIEQGQMITVAQVTHRGNPAGSVMTLSSLSFFSRYMSTILSGSTQLQLIIANDGLTVVNGGALVKESLIALAGLGENSLIRLDGHTMPKSLQSLTPYNLGLRTPIESTQLSIVTLLSASIVYGHIISQFFLYLASSVPVLLVLSILWMFRQRKQTDDFKAVAVTANRGRRELSDRNNLLTIEIGRRETLELELRSSEERYRTYIDQAPIGIFMTHEEDTFALVNPAISQMTGFSKRELSTMRLRDLFLLETLQENINFFDIAHHKSLSEKEVTLRKKDGSVLVTYVRVITLPGENVMGFCVDISERKIAEKKIYDLAFFDVLTGLPNRRQLLDKLRQALSAGLADDNIGALLMLDLDHFKNLNDTLGHDVGDRLLKQVGSRLLASVGPDDTVSRMGGDEFVIILERIGKDPIAATERVHQIAKKIHSSVSELYLLTEDLADYYITSSIGLTLFGDQNVSIDSLLKKADVALYEAKKDGRNTFRVFSAEMQASIDESTSLINALRHALQNKEFGIYYQPQVNSAGQLVGAEALLRWMRQDLSIALPGSFITAAEESGLIIPIGDWVIDQCCQQLKRWQQDAQTRMLRLSINISASQFRQLDFVVKLRAAIDLHNIDPTCIMLELTESALLHSVEHVIARMFELKSYGVRFSLDDFGTGYSSLSYLKLLPLDQVKIDGSFVRDISFDPDDAAIVRAILAMSKSLGLNVIAEGVETPAQREFLFKHGCMVYQGYLFGRPVPIEVFNSEMLTNLSQSCIIL